MSQSTRHANNTSQADDASDTVNAKRSDATKSATVKADSAMKASGSHYGFSNSQRDSHDKQPLLKRPPAKSKSNSNNSNEANCKHTDERYKKVKAGEELYELDRLEAAMQAHSITSDKKIIKSSVPVHNEVPISAPNQSTSAQALDLLTPNPIDEAEFLRRDVARHSKTLFWAEFKWLLTLAIVGGTIGWYFGVMAWGIVAGLLTFYAWQSYIMQQFYRWLRQSSTLPPPDFSGSLSFVANKLYTSKKQEQLTHQKIMGLIKKIRSSLLALQDAVILLDSDDSLEWWNQAAENLLELRSEDQGRSILELINIPEFHAYYADSAKPDEGTRFQSWRDPERYLQCEVTHFGEEKLLIIYDVTRLQHLEQMRKDFVGNVSHELRTPLTVLMGYIETFSDQPDLDPKWQRGFKLMTQQTRRMNSIINDLLLLSRLENEEISRLQCVDIPRMLAHIFDDAQVYNKDYGHLIDLHIDSQKNLYGSEMYLNSALLNLVTNAIKYTPKGGEISVSWQEVKGGCLFSVTDNGIGIAEEHIERLTERFYRVDSGRSRATGGTGLGLAIVKHVLYQHDAKLTIQSVENKGSTFNVFFPDKRVCGDAIQSVTGKSVESLDLESTEANQSELQDSEATL